MSKIVLGVIVESIATRADNSFKIVVGTQEIDRTQVADLFELVNKFSKMLLSTNNISPLEETLIDEQKLKDGKKVKTKSQRLRAVLYRVWEIAETPLAFDEFYDAEMEKYIDMNKQKLD